MSDQVVYQASATHPQGVLVERPSSLGGPIILLFAIAATMIARQLFWKINVPLTQQMIAAGLSVLLFASLAMFVLHVARTQPPVPRQHAFTARVVVLIPWVVLLLGWGLMNDSVPNDAFKESIVFLQFAMLLFLGRHDAVWQAAKKPLLVVFYLSFLLVLLTYKVPGVITSVEGSTEANIKDLPRNLDTIGFSCRILLNTAFLLTAWGLVTRRRDIWRWLMLGTLPAYCFAYLLLFGFRGSVILVVTLLAGYFLLLPVVRRQIPVGMFAIVAVAGIIGILLASRTEAYSKLVSRFEQEQTFGTRVDEARAFFRDMGPLDLVVGRGMGGWYRGPYWAKGALYKGQWHWSANHFGLLGFVLRGGYLMLLFMLSFVIPFLLPKGLQWYRNEYNLTAYVVAPVLVVNALINPLLFTPDSFFDLLVAGLCFARFSTPVTDTHLCTTTEPLRSDGYEY